MNNEIKEFKNGIFSLNTRRFGKVAELMIKEIYGFDKADNNAYDLKSKDNKKIEVKFSTVLKKCSSTITKKNLIKSVINSNYHNRRLTYENAINSSFDCNIQQIKIKEFDYLYYGCFFDDKIVICKIKANEIIKDSKIFYSDRQHRGNKGEGQFHINNSTLENHLEKYLVEWITYEQLYDLFKQKIAN